MRLVAYGSRGLRRRKPRFGFMDAGLYNSLMVQLLVGDPQDPRVSPYFKLVYDNVFARIYEVL